MNRDTLNNLRAEIERQAEAQKAQIKREAKMLSLSAEMLWANDQAGAAAPIATQAQAYEPLMTVEEAAAYLKIKPQTLGDWAKAGSIPCERANSEIRFRRPVLDNWLACPPENTPTDKATGVESGRVSILRPQRSRGKSNGASS
jgi:excisionase family DNA binding protein